MAQRKTAGRAKTAAPKTAEAPKAAKAAPQKRELVSYAPAEIQGLLDLIPRRSVTGKRHRALIALLFGAGLRVAEIVALRAVDLQDTADGLLVVVQRGKGHKPRTVPVLAQMRPYVDAWRDARRGLKRGKRALRGADPLLCVVTNGTIRSNLGSKRDKAGASVVDPQGRPVRGVRVEREVRVGDPMSTDSIRVALKRLERKARERSAWDKPLRPHALRHSYACALADAGTPPADIQVLLGHEGIATTAHYLRTYGRDAAIKRAHGVRLEGLAAVDKLNEPATKGDDATAMLADALRALPAEQRRALARALLHDEEERDQHPRSKP